MRSLKLTALIGLMVAVFVLGEIAMLAQRANEVVLNEGTRMTIRLNDFISTKTARQGDRFTAEVVSSVLQNRDVVIPAGSIVTGRVTQVKRPGRIKGKAELYLRPESIKLPNGAEESMVASVTGVSRGEKGQLKKGGEGSIEGEGSKGRDAAVIGTAGGVGAGIGAIAGGAKGTAIGGGSGALIGLAGVLATRGKDLELARGTELDIVLDRPLRISAY